MSTQLFWALFAALVSFFGVVIYHVMEAPILKPIPQARMLKQALGLALIAFITLYIITS